MASLNINLTGASLQTVKILLAKRGASFFSTPLKEQGSDNYQMDGETGEVLHGVVGTILEGVGPVGEDGKQLSLVDHVASIVMPESTVKAINDAANSNGVNALVVEAKCNPNLSPALIDGEVRLTVWVRPTGEIKVSDAPALEARKAEEGLADLMALAAAGNEERKAQALANRPTSVRESAKALLAKIGLK